MTERLALLNESDDGFDRSLATEVALVAGLDASPGTQGFIFDQALRLDTTEHAGEAGHRCGEVVGDLAASGTHLARRSAT